MRTGERVRSRGGTTDGLPRWRAYVRRSPWAGYGVAVAGAALAGWLRWMLGAILGPGLSPYITFYPVIMLSAVLGGIGAGILATLLSAGIVDYLFLEPFGFGFVKPVDYAGLTLFVFVNLMISVAGGKLRSAMGRMRRQAEELERTVAMVDLANVFVRDWDGRILRWSTGCERLYGYTARQAVGRRSHELLQTQFPAPLEQIRTLLNLDGRWEGELTHQTADGRTLVIRSEWLLARATSEEPEAIIEVNADITERKAVEQALRETRDQLVHTNAELERKVEQRTATLRETVGDLEHLSYSIVHDMRAPLRAMRGFAGILLEECVSCLSPVRQDYLRRITEAANRMDRLIEDALDYSQALRRAMPLKPIDTDSLLRGMLRTYPSLQHHHEHIHILGHLPLVLGNEAGLTQCFSNLLNNALKFVAAGQTPEVRVWAEPNGNLIRLCFADHGIGVPPEALTRIFDMFQRATKDYDGTGIGLALVRKVTERMGGHVGVDSTLGEGSCFWLELQPAA